MSALESASRRRGPVASTSSAEIRRLKKERNAVILAHYYQESEIQDLADFVGDCLELAQRGAEDDRPTSSPSAASTSWPRRRRS